MKRKVLADDEYIYVFHDPLGDRVSVSLFRVTWRKKYINSKVLKDYSGTTSFLLDCINSTFSDCIELTVRDSFFEEADEIINRKKINF